jgi:D-arginine dehydrogenase
MNFDVIIIGGGVLGVSAAYHLSKQNKRVLVLEREQLLGTHASGKNAGMFRQLYRHPQLTEWAYRSRLNWPEEIKEKTFKETGSYVVGRTIPNHHQFLFQQKNLSILKQVENSELTVTEDVSAVFTESDGLLDSCSYLQMLFKATDKNLATFKLNTEVTNLEKTAELWEVETKTGEKFSAPWVINCAGAWINKFLYNEFSSIKLNTNAFARHLFVVEGWDKNYMPENKCGFYWDEINSWYLRNWSESERLVSICDRAKADPDNFSHQQHLNEKVSKKLLSALPQQAEKLNLGRSWHCFRTYTEDQLPVWGEDPTYSGLFWLAAFGGFGMSTSFAASEDAALYISKGINNVEKDFLPIRVQETKMKHAIN